MAGQVVSVRLDRELLAWADELAKQRKSSRTAVVSAALEAFREASGSTQVVRGNGAGGQSPRLTPPSPGPASTRAPARKARVEKASSIPGVTRASRLPLSAGQQHWQHLPTCKCAVCRPGAKR